MSKSFSILLGKNKSEIQPTMAKQYGGTINEEKLTVTSVSLSTQTTIPGNLAWMWKKRVVLSC